MKKIRIICGKDEVSKVEKVIKELIYTTESLDNNLVGIDIYVKDSAVDELIPKLENSIDLRRRENMIEVNTPDFIISSSLKRVKEKKAKEVEPVEKLLDSVKKYTRIDVSKTVLTIIAGIIAMIGLFMNNIPIIIGAMLLSPLLGPIYSFVINTSVGRERDVAMSVLNLTVLLFLVIFSAYTMTILISQFMNLHITSEIIIRMDTNPIYILMALLLGFAAVFAYAKGLSESITGIAIAAALLPPMVVSGIILALSPENFWKPFILTFENIVGLITGGLIAILSLKIEPRRYYEKAKARRFMVRIYITLLALILILILTSLFL